jgi:PAS domain-containing protein
MRREQRKRAEESGQDQSEGRYRALFENAPVGITIDAPRLHIVLANQAYIQMFGHGQEAEVRCNKPSTGSMLLRDAGIRGRRGE